ncbi:hypothetical protein DLAC_05149 [Tieghemostelium lacteum]|uniref:Transmembrane protein n=1 Tax=Tieghemostelium lacteum TaxID=361077 RepID=A0A151ZIN5_TIELA|nr:hypothetical protein DLAC_05149 [Tieghemostelium lacteum]|eukprot:KYQ93759.1 hypothetical protein DLAC_05149 [Tieghemostelium lacteum]
MATPVKKLPGQQKYTIRDNNNSFVDNTFILLFLGSGVLNTLIVQLIFNNISFNTKSMFTNLVIFSGYAFLRYIKEKPAISNTVSALKKKTRIPPMKFIVLSIFDCIASLLTTIGQIAVGSGLFQVLFSSKILFSALLSRFYLGNPLSMKKWFSILFIFFGLCISVINPELFKKNLESENQSDDIGSGTPGSGNLNYYFLFGVGSVLTAAFIFSSSHIYSEKMLREYDVGPFSFASSYGTYSVAICLSYIFTVTLYNYKEWVWEPIHISTNEQITMVLLLISVLIFTSFARASSVFKVLSKHGSVSLGVLYALQSIIVFTTSALYLCDPDHPLKRNQCFTTPKTIGSMIVILGSLYYTILNSNHNSSNQSTITPKKLDFNKK